MASVIPRLAAVAIVAVLPVLGLVPSSIAQSPPPKTDTTRGLSIQYADGRVSTGPVRRTGGMWTSTFPTIAGADTSRNGVRLRPSACSPLIVPLSCQTFSYSSDASDSMV